MNRGELHRLRTGSPAHRPRPSGSASTFLLPREDILLLRASSPLPLRSDSHSFLRRVGSAWRFARFDAAPAHRAHGGRESQSAVESLHRCAVRSARWFPPFAPRPQLDGGAQSSRMAAWLGHGSPPIARGDWRSVCAGSRSTLRALAASAGRTHCRCACSRRSRWLSLASSWALSCPASGYGTETSARWAVVYTHPLAARWSGTPLFVPVHPVQAYAALAFLAISVSLFLWTPHRRQRGEVAGMVFLRLVRPSTSRSSGAIPRDAARSSMARWTDRSWPRLCWF